MKTSIISIALSATLFGVTLLPVSAMTNEELSAELNELTTSLALIGSTISNSPDLTEEESATLMTQLVAISGEILALQATIKPVPATVLEEYEAADSTRATAQAAGLELLTLSYDATTKNAEAELEFSTTTKRHSYKLIPPAGASYSSEIDLITKQVLDDLAVRYTIQRGDMAQMLRFTSRNPVRDTQNITKNSALAEELAINFGLRSIVNQIDVRPTDSGGVIDFSSDQEELLRLSLDKNFDSNNGSFLGTYTYRVLYYLTDDNDWDDFDSEGNPVAPTAEYELFADDVVEDDVTEVTQSIVDYVPFASSITNFNQKLVDFLTENTIYYRYDSGNFVGNEPVLDCYYESDKLALSEFLLYILQGISANYEPDVVATAQYRAPAQFEEYGWNTCVNKKRFF